ncbi:MAG: substrate-binding domain-containing protein [Pseudomonadota bacterium]|nr:substrate-binding domain-containing protein [Pseudomonadota bacterium]
MRRRPFLAAAAVAAIAGAPARPWARGVVAGAPLRLGVDSALVESGLGRSLQHAFGADTGILVNLVGGPALTLLDAIREGELDALLSNAPEAEARLEKQGLVHDRRPVASGEFVLVGPVPARPRGKAAAPPAHSGVEAVVAIRDLAANGTAGIVFLSPGDGSGTHVAEQGLWRGARIDPAAPWYALADPKRPFVAQVRARGAYALVERGAWAVAGGAPLALLVEQDPSLAETVRVMRAFHVTHPAGKIFVNWIAGGRGRAVVASHRGYRALDR